MALFFINCQNMQTMSLTTADKRKYFITSSITNFLSRGAEISPIRKNKILKGSFFYFFFKQLSV